MATEKFTYDFLDVKGFHFGINIYKDNAATPYVIENGSDMPVVLSHTGGAKDEWDNTILQGQELTFDFLIPQADVSKINEIFESEYQDYMLEYTMYPEGYPSVLIFKGWIKPENLYKTLDTNEPQVAIKLSATDGLGDLKKIEFRNADRSLITGRYSLLAIIKKALTPLNTALNFNIQLNSWDTGTMTYDECALEKMYSNCENYFEISDNGAPTVMNCWDVIEAVLKCFNVKFHQYLGEWCITNFFELNSYSHRYLSTDLSLISRTSKFNSVDLSDWLFSPGIDQQKIHPLKAILTKSKNKDVGGDVSGADLADWEGSWTIAFYTHSVLSGGVLQLTSLSGSAEDNFIELASDFSISQTSSDDYLKINFDYKIEAVTCSSLPEDLQLRVQIKRSNETWSIPILAPLYGRDWIHFEALACDALKIPIGSGSYNVRISFGTKDNSRWDWLTASFKIKNVSIPKIQASSDQYNPVTIDYDEQYYQHNTKGVEELNFETLIADGKSITETGAFLTYDGQWGITSHEWNTYTHTEQTHILDLCVRNILANRKSYKDFLRLEIFDFSNVLGFDNYVYILDKIYAFNTYSKDFKNCKITAELIELTLSEDLTVDYTEWEEVGLKKATFKGSENPVTNPIGYYQPSHGFLVGDVIAIVAPEGEDPYFILATLGGDYLPIGIVSDVLSGDDFNYVSEGYINHPDIHYLLGYYYYLDSDHPGKTVLIPTLAESGLEQAVGFGTHLGFKVEIDNLQRSGGGASAPTTVSSSSTNSDNGTNHTHGLDNVGTAKSVTLASITVDAKGRVTACSSGSGGGASAPTTVSSSSTNSDNGTNHTHGLDNVGTAKSVTLASITVDAKGRVTACSSGSVVDNLTTQVNVWNTGTSSSLILSGLSKLSPGRTINLFFTQWNRTLETLISGTIQATYMNFAGGVKLFYSQSVPFVDNCKIEFVDESGEYRIKWLPKTGTSFGFAGGGMVAYTNQITIQI